MKIGLLLTFLVAPLAHAFWFFDSSPERVELTEERLLESQDSWDLLIPQGAYDFVPENLTDALFFSESFQEEIEAAGRLLNPDVNGRWVAMGGFMVPLELDGDEVKVFLLVPEAGQCIHIPPPPANQTVLVDTSADPIPLRSLYDPIWIEGPIETYEQSTQLAQVGYRMIMPKVLDLTIPGFDPSLVPRHEGD